MTATFQAVFRRAHDCFAQAQAAGWLDDADVARLAAVEQGTPGQLFVDQPARPLVVAFFGGTGVGKSSLLNRLAGEPIARTSAERPTSREATLYLHESVKLADLPPELPIESVRVRRHRSDVHRGVLWIDAPDIDSTVEENRRSALAWLPHVDLVCYVVSPERYRDDVGWRILKQRGGKHGWMFVINRWDEGDARQRDDFARLLLEAGFEDPVLLVTCCAPAAADRALPTPDEFEQVQANLAGLVDAHVIEEFTRLGHRARLLELQGAIQAAEPKLGSDETRTEVGSANRQRWHATAQAISAGAEWAMRTLAAHCASAKDNKLDEVADALWDDWAESKLQAYLDATELAIRRGGISAGPCRRRLDEAGTDAGARVAQQLRDHLRAGLARPGTPLVRLTRRLTRLLTFLLPLIALLWVAWAVVVGYHRAVLGAAPFRGTDMAIHSFLVVLIAWAVPFTLDRLLRPSVEETALRALRSGLWAGLDDLGQQFERAFAAAAAEAAEHRRACNELLADVEGMLRQPRVVDLPALSRLVVTNPGQT
jgi:hypothetical protein